MLAHPNITIELVYLSLLAEFPDSNHVASESPACMALSIENSISDMASSVTIHPWLKGALAIP